jgi:hypothetical protein
MPTINYAVVATRLTADRLRSYLAATGGDLEAAIGLYDWNTQIGAALHEDIGRLEVVFRNALDVALVSYGSAQGWPTVWYDRRPLFPGRHGRRALEDIVAARGRATRRGRPEAHGKVVAELNLGFWRYLCTPPYLTSLWVPALADAFPHHREPGDPRTIRRDVEDRIQRLHFLRNRIAHHEPIHHRNLERDLADLVQLTGWICADTQAWIVATSRTSTVLAARP